MYSDVGGPEGSKVKSFWPPAAQFQGPDTETKTEYFWLHAKYIMNCNKLCWRRIHITSHKLASYILNDWLLGAHFPGTELSEQKDDDDSISSTAELQICE
jgi:hypothetical protein